MGSTADSTACRLGGGTPSGLTGAAMAAARSMWLSAVMAWLRTSGWKYAAILSSRGSTCSRYGANAAPVADANDPSACVAEAFSSKMPVRTERFCAPSSSSSLSAASPSLARTPATMLLLSWGAWSSSSLSLSKMSP
eukprot:1762021-Pyramimonas_sp.AAC.1